MQECEFHFQLQRDHVEKVRALREQMASLEADVSELRAELAHLVHSTEAAKGWYFNNRTSCSLCAFLLLERTFPQAMARMVLRARLMTLHAVSKLCPRQIPATGKSLHLTQDLAFLVFFYPCFCQASY